jgi:hypothetical protein
VPCTFNNFRIINYYKYYAALPQKTWRKNQFILSAPPAGGFEGADNSSVFNSQPPAPHPQLIPSVSFSEAPQFTTGNRAFLSTISLKPIPNRASPTNANENKTILIIIAIV